MRVLPRWCVAASMGLGTGCVEAPPVPPPEAAADATHEQRARLERYWQDCAADRARGCAALGSRYLEGDGVAPDLNRAYAAYARACELGERCAAVGYLHQEGLGVPGDPAEAARWYAVACERGEAEGCANLGVLLQRGRGGPVDLAGAARRFDQGCALGDPNACVNLGFMLQLGTGVPRDLDRARALYGQACDAGHRTGCNNRAVIDEGGVEGRFLSPSDGGDVTVGRVALGVALPAAFGPDAAVAFTLDGAPIDTPLLLRRDGLAGAGQGTLALAMLELGDVEAGPHELTATVTAPSGGAATLRAGFTYAPPPHRVTLSVTDAAGAPVSARVVVLGPNGPLALGGADADTLDTMGRMGSLSSVFAPEGVAQLRLPPGRWRFVAFAGLRRDLGVAAVTVKGDVTVALTAPVAVPTPDHLAVDLHVHTGASRDAHVPHRLRLESLRAGGLDVVALTDHDRLTDPGSLQPAAGDLVLIPGVEADLSSSSASGAGHVNLLPLDPTQGWTPGPIDLAAARAHAPRGERLLQLNHPRGIQFNDDNPPRLDAHAPFADSDPRSTLDIDALEVVNRFSWPLYRAVRADWFAMLARGQAPTATGNSDSHGVAVEEAGMTINLVRLQRGPGDSAATVGVALVEAVRSGQLTVSTGPIVDLVVEGATTGRPGDHLAHPGRAVTVTARVRAAPWVPVPELRLVQDGVVVARVALPAPAGVGGLALDHHLTVTRPVNAASWFVAEAGWPLDDDRTHGIPVGGDYATVAPGFVPLGFTNPVWVAGPGGPG